MLAARALPSLVTGDVGSLDEANGCLGSPAPAVGGEKERPKAEVALPWRSLPLAGLLGHHTVLLRSFEQRYQK